MNSLLADLISLVTVEGIHSIVSRVDEALRQSAPLRIGYLNAQVCAVARSHANALAYLKNCDILLPDGAPVAWLARCVGRRRCEKVTVTELLPFVLEAANEKRSSILILGSAVSTHDAFIAMCAKQYARTTVSCIPYNVMTGDAPGTVSAIRVIDPDVLLVALGAPYQEIFLETSGAGLSARIIITCGGAIDVISGKKKRAPRWTHAIGVEWVYRALREPRRLLWRYVKTNVIFLGMSISFLFHCIKNAGRSRK